MLKLQYPPETGVSSSITLGWVFVTKNEIFGDYSPCHCQQNEMLVDITYSCKCLKGKRVHVEAAIKSMFVILQNNVAVEKADFNG